MDPRNASEVKGPQRHPQRRLERRLEEVAKAVGGGYCRLQMPLKPALGVRETVAGRPGGGRGAPPFQCIPDGPLLLLRRYGGLCAGHTDPPRKMLRTADE